MRVMDCGLCYFGAKVETTGKRGIPGTNLLYIYIMYISIVSKGRQSQRDTDCPFTGFAQQMLATARAERGQTRQLLLPRMYINKKIEPAVQSSLEPGHGDMDCGCLKQ